MTKFTFKSLAVAMLVLGSVVAMAQDGGGRQGGRRGGGQFGRQVGRNAQMGPMLLFRSDVQADLQLTDDQKSKLDTLRSELRGAGGRRRGGGGGNGDAQPAGQRPTREAMAQRRAEQEKKVNEILTPDQQKRLKEIQVQLAGPQVLTVDEFQKELGLTTAQIAKVESLQRTYREAMTSVREKAQKQELDRQAAADAQKKNVDTLREELQKVLTPAQAEKLKAMGGKPFKADAEGR
jgi:uncharacterized protein YPO0396